MGIEFDDISSEELKLENTVRFCPGTGVGDDITAARCQGFDGVVDLAKGM